MIVAEDVQDENTLRWHIEQFHREEKQLTSIERSPYRLNRSQRNHICSATLVWIRLKQAAYATRQTVYALKEGLLHDYLVKELGQGTSNAQNCFFLILRKS